MSSNKKVEKLDDLKGVKLRVPPLKMYRMTWEYLGASPTPMGVAKLFTSMQNGVVDARRIHWRCWSSSSSMKCRNTWSKPAM